MSKTIIRATLTNDGGRSTRMTFHPVTDPTTGAITQIAVYTPTSALGRWNLSRYNAGTFSRDWVRGFAAANQLTVLF